MSLTFILLAAAVQATGAPAQTAPAVDQPTTERPDIIVTCRTVRVTGTRIFKKVCRSPEQQRQADLEARNKLRMGTRVQATEVFKRPKGE
ncbi:MAG TPA: hypothetical protein VFO45_02900 [Sphingomicrobium sp.]|nr:hypothetical protein [Sphingomicrobium sp.]